MITMSEPVRIQIALFLTFTILLAGCTSSDIDTDKSTEKIGEETEQTPNPNQDEAEKISIPSLDYCDNTNPHHCLLPFPSGAFLVPDNDTITGYRLNIPGKAIPDSNSAVSTSFSMINSRDGNSPSTQIFTTFDATPNLSGLANQNEISLSINPDHETILLNMDTGKIIPHWVEESSRKQDNEPTLIHIRTIKGLDHNSKYAVAFRNLVDDFGEKINPSLAFQSLRDGNLTDSTPIENMRESYEEMFSSLEKIGIIRSNLQSAWWFHTASTDSITEDIITIRDDASERLGESGIGCNVTEVIDDFGEDNTTFRLIKGTIVTPHYLKTVTPLPPTQMKRDANGTPQFTFYTEVVFTLLIPQSAAISNSPAPLMVLGHGFMGDGEGIVAGLREWSNEYGYATIATDFKGWSSDGDYDAITFGLLNINYLQHQSERLQQSVINHLAMIKTIKGVCSDLDAFYHNNTNLVDSSGDLNYLGISLGGIRGPSMLSLIPELNNGVLFVAGSSFSFIAERSTQYTQFELLFGSPLAYPSTNDRSILIALCQSMWDATEPETYLAFREGGLDGQLNDYEVLYIVSINDAQVSILSADRAARTADLINLENSTYHPHGIQIETAPYSSSGIVYFDGGFPDVPTGNIQGPMEYHSLAHNQVLIYEGAVVLAHEYLESETITDTCSGKCYFEGEW